MFKRRLVSFLVLVFLFAAAVSPGLRAEEKSEGVDLIPELKLFSKALGVISDAYVEDVEARQMLYEAVKGMLASLDSFSEFIDPQRYELMQIHMRGEYAGIGAILQMLGNVVAVRAVKPGSAAEKAGLQPLDKILKINGELTKEWDIPEVASKLRGDANTTLVVTIQRDLERRIFDVEITREKIEIEAAKEEKLVGESIGYIQIATWSENMGKQMDKKIAELEEKGMKALIIDLRNNDGGLLPQAVALSGRFLPKGKKVVSVESKIEEQRKEYFSEGEDPSDLKLIILVNENTASASEIFSAAMQDHGRATVIGTKTFGKGSVQSLIPLDDVSAMKLTTARYKTPGGRLLDHAGLEPDIVLEPSDGGPDHAMLKALELFKDYM